MSEKPNDRREELRALGDAPLESYTKALEAISIRRRKPSPMTDQPTDRAEKLRKLSFEELIDRTVQHRLWVLAVQNFPNLVSSSDLQKGAEIRAEWNRREAELKRLREPRPMETAPRDRTSVLIWPKRRNRWMVGYWREQIGLWHTDDSGWDDLSLLGWLPLPPQPQEASE